MSESFWPDRNIPRIAPGSLDPDRVTYFGETDARNKRRPFGIKASDRTRHMYVIGKTGMGKSTLLENLAIQDIQNGEGLCFIDPHGKTADLLLDYVPEERMDDVLYFAPFDTEYPVSFNVMEDVGEDKRHLVISGLMSAFKKLWGEESFSDRMQYILQNTLHALLEYPGATLLGVNRMYTDANFRNKVVDNISDMSVKTYWVEEFAGYTERFAAEATPAIQNKIGQFTSNPLIRNVIGQPKSSFDLRKIMDDQKIMIVNLSKGRVGENNANLLGSMLITKLYLAAMSRADGQEGEHFPPFHLYVDEFQSFANESFADILSEARKYSLTLTVAHQYMAQMSEEVRDAVIGNVGTMIMFRVGGADAEELEKEFSPTFTVEDMVNLGFAQVYLKLMIDGVGSQPFSATTLPPIQKQHESLRDSILAASREHFAAPRLEVEKAIVEWQDKQSEPMPDARKGASKKQSSKSRGAGNGKGPKPAPPIEEEKESKNPFANIVVGESGKVRMKSEGDEEFASLKRLADQKKPKRGQKPDTKGPTMERVSELKNALASFVSGGGKSVPKEPEVKEKKEVSQKQNKKMPEPVRPSEIKKSKSGAKEKKEEKNVAAEKPKEITKSELENMLRVEGEE